jgi:hypothetical protein
MNICINSLVVFVLQFVHEISPRRDQEAFLEQYIFFPPLITLDKKSGFPWLKLFEKTWFSAAAWALHGFRKTDSLKLDVFPDNMFDTGTLKFTGVSLQCLLCYGTNLVVSHL